MNNNNQTMMASSTQNGGGGIAPSGTAAGNFIHSEQRPSMQVAQASFQGGQAATGSVNYSLGNPTNDARPALSFEQYSVLFDQEKQQPKPPQPLVNGNSTVFKNSNNQLQQQAGEKGVREQGVEEEQRDYYQREANIRCAMQQVNSPAVGREESDAVENQEIGEVPVQQSRIGVAQLPKHEIHPAAPAAAASPQKEKLVIEIFSSDDSEEDEPEPARQPEVASMSRQYTASEVSALPPPPQNNASEVAAMQPQNVSEVAALPSPQNNTSEISSSWMRMYSHLKVFQKEHDGSIEVSADDFKHHTLRRWIAFQRKRYRKDPVNGIPTRERQLLDEIGFVWSPATPDESQKKKRPKKKRAKSSSSNDTDMLHHRRHVLEVPRDRGHDGDMSDFPEEEEFSSDSSSAPGEAVDSFSEGDDDSQNSNDRKLPAKESTNAKGNENNHDFASSESERDSEDSSNDDASNKQWESNFLKLKAFHKKHNSWNPKQSDDGVEPGLPIWVFRLRQDYDEKRLSDYRIKMLSEAGVDWVVEPSDATDDESHEGGGEWQGGNPFGNSANERRWKTSLQKLKEFHRTHNSWNPPRSYSTNLHVWVKKHRTEYHRNKLSDVKKQMLNDIFFEWQDPNEDDNKGKNDENPEGNNGEKVRRETPRVFRLETEDEKKAHERRRREAAAMQKALLRPERSSQTQGRNHKQWMKRFHEVKEHREQHGTSDRSLTSSLKNWVTLQRRRKWEGVLLKERLDLLEGIGFDFDPQAPLVEEQDHDNGRGNLDTAPNRNIKPLSKLKTRETTRNISQSEPEADDSDTSDSNDGYGTRRQKKTEKKWKNQFQKLKNYYERNGDHDVTQKQDSSLYFWINEQRRQYQRDEGMQPNRVALMDSIHFDWHNNDDREPKSDFDEPAEVNGKKQRKNASNFKKWMKNYNWLKKYQKQNGSCNVQYSDLQHQTLYHWARRQRKLYDDGELSRTKVKLLHEIGFWVSEALPTSSSCSDSDSASDSGSDRSEGNKNAEEKISKDEAWAKRYQELKEFKQRFGTMDVQKADTEYRQLHNWIVYQRRQWRNKKMPDDRRKLLDRIGFRWVSCREEAVYRSLDGEGNTKKRGKVEDDDDDAKPAASKKKRGNKKKKKDERKQKATHQQKSADVKMKEASSSDGRESYSSSSSSSSDTETSSSDSDSSEEKRRRKRKHKRSKSGSRSRKRARRQDHSVQLPVPERFANDMTQYLQWVEQEIQKKEEEVRDLQTVASRIRDILLVTQEDGGGKVPAKTDIP